MSEWYHSYEPVFQPLKDKLTWLDSEGTRLVMPNPRLIRNKGRPVFARIRIEMDRNDRELPTSLWIENGLKSRCGLCRQEGYNHRTCLTRNGKSTSGGAASVLKRLRVPLVDRISLTLPRQNMDQYRRAVAKIRKEDNLMLLRRCRYHMLQLVEELAAATNMQLTLARCNNVLNYEDYLSE
ncbi:hypothetical protein SO802_017785 [Lithocarpus litseifolius]|uniref:Uncharacterized protein n=1 Tax=Lithocarpus litseifolius TaxID=425828 RepID=A0AAW2CKW7_9ROSI